MTGERQPLSLPVEARHDSMRGYFAYELHERMLADSRIWLVTADLGYLMFDFIQRDFPDRFINTGAAETAALGMSIGLASEGKLPFCYSITPFLLYRPFEQIRNYLHREAIPVCLCGSGRDKSYLHDGYSHWAEEVKAVLGSLTGIKTQFPVVKEEIPAIIDGYLEKPEPTFISLMR